jgi:argininosuccinate lyase
VDLAGRVTRLMAGVISSLEVHPERMWEALLGGFSQATDLAEHVMLTCNVDYRTAYLVVGRAVRAASAQGLRGVDLTGELLVAAAVEQIGHPLGLSGSDLSSVVDPRAVVQTRVAPGGAAPAVVRGMAERCRQEALAMADRTKALTAAFSDTEFTLIRQAEEVADHAVSPR